MNIEQNYLDNIDVLIKLAFEEDIANGDVTTNSLIESDKVCSGFFMTKEEGIVSGLEVAKLVFEKLDDKFIWNPIIKDGERVSNKTVIVKFKGSHRALLTGERTALNFIQRMSGISTKTNLYVNEVKDYKTEILDTRKTLPGFRLLDKYAVKMGGGTNHRFGLYDLVMIKDNHITVAGSITKAVERIRNKNIDNLKIEVETKNIEEVKEALDCKVDIIMLDNMSTSEMELAVKIIDGQATSEASGNMVLERLKEVAAAGVDFISVGALTHSVKGLDISMYTK
ncbi:MAG: carboxylating nicotinate-nucleotide diphosphorylase [Melioribacteraceae bacterium]